MIDSQSIDVLKSQGYLVMSKPALCNEELLDCFRAFIDTDPAYKERYLQKRFGYAFDGYSYVGQPDSSNQAEDDLVSTFVLSEFYDVERYPSEFHRFLHGGWRATLQTIRALEIEALELLNIPGLLDFYRQNVGHMISNNYYPPIRNFAATAADNTRLSAHPDASLFTIFPFGIDDDLELELIDDSGLSAWQSVQASASMLLYPGYLLELWTNGDIKALNHRVRLAHDVAAERFSFAFFSLPFPQREFVMPGRGTMTSEAYFEAYVGLF